MSAWSCGLWGRGLGRFEPSPGVIGSQLLGAPPDRMSSIEMATDDEVKADAHALATPPGLGRVGQDVFDAEPLQGTAHMGGARLVDGFVLHRGARRPARPIAVEGLAGSSPGPPLWPRSVPGLTPPREADKSHAKMRTNHLLSTARPG